MKVIISMEKKNFGFTLIELLIVVAIIAILAVIAIPNFLAAQTRSKVATNRADFRTLTTALESYYVDNNCYPMEWQSRLVDSIRPDQRYYQ
jgi:type II secretion system protein G